MKQQHAEHAETQAQTTVEEKPSILDQAIANTRTTTRELSEIVSAFSALANADEVEKSLTLAVAMTEIRKRLDSQQQIVMELMNKPIGFLTDKDPNRDPKTAPYPWEVVRDCVAEVLLCGGRLTGNEFNIIAGKKYDTQAFFKRKFKELPGVTDVQEMYGAVVYKGDRAYVSMILQWMQNGRQRQIRFIPFEGFDRRIGVRVNSGMGEDAVLGKAARKAFKAAYEYLTGATVADDDEAEEVSLDPIGLEEARAPSSNSQPQKAGTCQASERQLAAIAKIRETRKISDARAAEIFKEVLGRETFGEVTSEQAQQIISKFQAEKPV